METMKRLRTCHAFFHVSALSKVSIGKSMAALLALQPLRGGEASPSASAAAIFSLFLVELRGS